MCGKCESFVHEFVGMGVDSWQPAQGMNDIAGIQAKYGKDLVINGGWRTEGPAWCPGASEDLVRSELRKCFDALAGDSAFIFWTGGQVGFTEDQAARFGWVTDEARSYGKQFYI